MNSDPHEVAIVVDRDFSSRLSELAGTMHVWVCDTPSNRAVSEAIWDDNPIYDLESGVTTFNFPAEVSAAENVLAVLGEVDTHHGQYSHDPPWSVIRVVGCIPNKDLIAAFTSFDAKIFLTGPDAFEARR